MKVIFCLFGDYEAARTAVATLVHDDFPEGEMNVIVQDSLAKSHMSMDVGRSNVAQTERPPGLDRIVAGRQTVDLGDVGSVYAAGESAGLIAKSADARGGSGKGLASELAAFGIPPDTAAAFTAGIKGGGLLFFLRVPDERASGAVNLLREYKGEHITALPR